MSDPKPKVIIAISGGVDSGLAAYLLKKQGARVRGVYLRLGSGSNFKSGEQTARAICRFLNIEFRTIDLRSAFRQTIIRYFLRAYETGQTPNPCVVCNKQIKFGELLKLRRELKADFLATGHYARIMNYESRIKNYRLYKANDANKDQSYFLYNLKQAQLKHLLFPLGVYTKTEVRKLAQKIKLPHLEQESQDVCFLSGGGGRATADFLKKNLKFAPGPIKDANKHTLGTHQGLPLYTIGQRKGIAIGGSGPYYVVSMDYRTNTLYVTDNAQDANLYKKKIAVGKVNWISGSAPKLPLRCEAAIRYRHRPVKAKVIKLSIGKYAVEFSAPQRAVMPGQSVVFYRGNELLGGGIILN